MNIRFYLFVVGIVGIMGCSKGIDVEAEKQAILALMEKNSQALLNGDIEMMRDIIPNESKYIIHQGEVLKEETEVLLEYMQEQFEQGRYVSSTQLQDPVISLSKDGTMAWTAGQIIFEFVPSDTTMKPRKIVDAALMVFEKQNGKWVNTASAETFPVEKNR